MARYTRVEPFRVGGLTVFSHHIATLDIPSGATLKVEVTVTDGHEGFHAELYEPFTGNLEKDLISAGRGFIRDLCDAHRNPKEIEDRLRERGEKFADPMTEEEITEVVQDLREIGGVFGEALEDACVSLP